MLFVTFQFITCPSVSVDGGPVISLSPMDNQGQVKVLWMANYHPDKTVQSYAVKINNQLVKDNVRIFFFST